MHLKTIKKLLIAVSAIGLVSTQAVYAKNDNNGAGNQEEPVELLVKFIITGEPSQMNPGAFTIGGPGYSTITTSAGAILDNVVPGLEVAQLSGAEITFGGQLTDPIVPFTCISGTCDITIGGSTFTSDAGAPLDGRLAGAWGPVMNSDFDPGVATPLRIFGCGGLTETSGKGDYAGMVGSICFNGVFNLPNFTTNFHLTGSSNCTITLHTPPNGPIPPDPGY